MASDQGATTLAISHGIPGWYAPKSGEFAPLRTPAGVASSGGSAVAVGAEGRLGVVAYGHGQLAEASEGGAVLSLPSVPGVPRAVAVAGGDPELVAVATSRGLFSGRLGGRLARVASGVARSVLAPPTSSRAWLALVNGRLWERSVHQGWAPAYSSPDFGPETTALTELSSGVILVGQPGGLIWRGDRDRWTRAFQVLPYGGLGGVPTVTSLAADGATSAYVGTDGFGTLLTPDGGYTWYRAPPPVAAISLLATVGPVFSAKAHGYVVAVSDDRVFLHQLQALPEPPTYSPTGETEELVGTAAVTLASALLITLLLWFLDRRQRHLSV
ncbi:MAG TPA: hypothetical protein VMW80_06735 [Candidatus Dormibacteraeota bacterium]|nr:hypothetical protein [Candidatus Dormibacteraeota bacterium]